MKIVYLVVTAVCIGTMVLPWESMAVKIVRVAEKDQPKLLTDRDLVSMLGKQ